MFVANSSTHVDDVGTISYSVVLIEQTGSLKTRFEGIYRVSEDLQLKTKSNDLRDTEPELSVCSL